MCERDRQRDRQRQTDRVTERETGDREKLIQILFYVLNVRKLPKRASFFLP